MELKDLGLQRINIDLNNDIITRLFAKEGDRGSRGLLIKILNNGVEVDATGISVNMYSRTPKGKIYETKATALNISKGEYELIYPTSILKSGKVKAELRLTKLGNVISSKTFEINVGEGIMSDDAIEGMDQEGLFDKLLQAGQNESERISAEAIRVASENKRVADEKARALVEIDRVTKESARVLSENTRNTSEIDRVAKEKTRVTNESNRSIEEAKRVNSETTRISNEDIRVLSEVDRVAKEKDRVLKETARASSENNRINKEKTRNDAETIRVTNEDDRILSETDRISNEKIRVSSEVIRVSQEGSRQASILSMQEWFNTTQANLKGDKGDKGDIGNVGPKGNPFIYSDFTPAQLETLKGPKGDSVNITKANVETALGFTPAKEQDLTAYKTDNAYQTPSIVGTQIRIKKEGTGKRLYFKLDADLTGNITISLNNGSTSKPLRDVEGVQVTDLDKGFIEVVEESVNFTLRSRGGGVNETLPPQIENFNSSVAIGEINLTWTISDTEFLDGYTFVYKQNVMPKGVKDGVKVNALKTATSLKITGLVNETLYYVRAFPYNSKKQHQTARIFVKGVPQKVIKINTLPVGAKIKLGKHQVNTETRQDIIWQIGAQNHPGYPSNSTTLVTEKIIDYRAVDAKEPSNSDANRKTYGNNRYKDSNLRQWLNKAGSPWFVKTHTTDMAPNNHGTEYNTGYDDRDGFLSAFTSEELARIMNTTLTVAKNTVTDGGGVETVTDKLFLLSNTEVGLANEPGEAEGSKLPLFTDNASRISASTQQAFSNTKNTNKPGAVGTAWYWWLRSPGSGYSHGVRFVHTSGVLSYSNAYNGYYGVRPALNLKSEILVSDTTDVDGCYTIYL